MTGPTTYRPSTNPFLPPTTLVDAPEVEHVRAVSQDKPWGHELIWADGTHGYVAKTISVRAGCALSLQRHHHKQETITVLSGEMLFESGPTPDALERATMLAGDTVHVPATVVHRITAVSDVVLAEASSADPGWRTDIERLSDDYGRSGTSAP